MKYNAAHLVRVDGERVSINGFAEIYGSTAGVLSIRV